MNVKRMIKNVTTVLFVLILIFSLNSCCNNNEGNTIVDTVKVVEIVKKTREELIVNRDTMFIANPENITDFENKHTPDITFGEIDEKGYAKIYVSVGSNGIVHPSTEEHWIDFMTLYIDGEEYKHIKVENGEGSNKKEFFAPIKKGQTVRIVIGCNLHGIWENSRKIDG